MSKTRFIHKPQLGRESRVIPIPKGGHDGVTAPEGADNIDLLTNSMVNQALGIAGSDSNNLVPVPFIPDGLTGSGSVNLIGPTTLEINQQGSYFITDYDTFLSYVITAINGSVSRLGDIITYTAPPSVGPGGFIVNGRQINIPITSSFSVNTPVITFPTNNATGIASALTFTSNAFAVSGGSDTHQGSDWQIATDAGFTNIVQQVTNSAASKTSWSVTGLNPTTTYYVRVRYKGTLYGYSNWGTAVAFTTQVASTVNQPTINVPAPDLRTNVTQPINFGSTAFNVNTGSDTHEGSDWQIATDIGFTNIVNTIVNSSINKTTYSVVGLTGGATYYIRVRYKGIAYGYSNWSTPVQFSTSAVVTYSVTPDVTVVNEGGTISFTINTQNLPNGTIRYWSINGTNVASGDFTPSGISGNVTINNNTATVVKTLVADTTTEGPESFVFNLRTGSVSGTIVASTPTITVNDSSTTPAPNTAPVITGIINTYGQPSDVQITAFSNNLNLYKAIFPETITVSDTQLDGINDWSGASVKFEADYSNTTGNTLDFNPVITTTGGAITLAVQNISGQNRYLVKHNNVAIGEYVKSDGLITITFGTTISKSVGAAAITNAHVKDTIIAMGFNVSAGSSPAINFTDSSITYVPLSITLYDGNTGAQGTGNNLNNLYGAMMCAPSGYSVGVGCFSSGGWGGQAGYGTLTADGAGGVTATNVIERSYNCGTKDLVVNAYAQTTGKIILLSNDGGNDGVTSTTKLRIGRLNTDGSLDTTFGTSGIYKHVGSDNTVKNIRMLPNNKIATVIANKILIISENGVQQSLTNNKPAAYPNSTIEDIVVVSSTELLVFGYYNPNGGDYRGIIYKVNASGVVDTNFTVYLTPTGTGNYPGITGWPRVKFNSGNNTFYLYIDNYITKFNYNGNSVSLDTSYGTSGTATISNIIVYSQQRSFTIENIIFQPNNKILAFERSAVIRLNLNGSLDTSFGMLSNSYWVTDSYIGKQQYDDCEITDVKLLSDNSVMVLWKGYLPGEYYQNTRMNISKLTNTGLYDLTYNTDGVAQGPYTVTIDDVYPKDRLVIVGDLPIFCMQIAPGNRSFKFLADGTLDGNYI